MPHPHAAPTSFLEPLTLRSLNKFAQYPIQIGGRAGTRALRRPAPRGRRSRRTPISRPGSGATPSPRRRRNAGSFLSSSSSNTLLLCGGLYGELYERPYNKILSAVGSRRRSAGSRPGWNTQAWTTRGRTEPRGVLKYHSDVVLKNKSRPRPCRQVPIGIGQMPRCQIGTTIYTVGSGGLHVHQRVRGPHAPGTIHPQMRIFW